METTQVLPAAPAKRRARGRGQAGSVFARGGSYTIIFRKPDGKQKWEGGFPTKRLAQDRLNDVLGQIGNNRYLNPSEMLFEDYCETWIKNAQTRLKPKTWGSYRSYLDVWILPEFKGWPLCDIGKPAVKAFAYKLLAKQALCRKSVKNFLLLLSAILESAVEDEHIVDNPARKIRLADPEDEEVDLPQSGKVVMPTPDEVVRTLSKLSATYQAMITTGAVAGLRRAELLGLMWDDIDCVNGTIQVRRSLQRVKKSLLDAKAFRGVERIGETGLALVPPKSRKSKRKVEMPPKLANLLGAIRQLRGGSDSEFVFQDELGRPLDPDGVLDVLHAAQDQAQVRRFGLHGLRHLYCSLLQESGASPKHAQERMGHASMATTMNVYTHTVSKEGREYAEKIEAAFPFVSALLAEGKEPSTVM